MLMSTQFKEELEPLREVIVREANKRRDFGSDELAGWLITKHRGHVIKALACCISDALDRSDDERRKRHILTAADKDKYPAKIVAAVRQLSETLCLPQWYLLEHVDDPRIGQLADAASLINSIRIEILDNQTAAMRHLQELISPVVDEALAAGRPEPNAGEALRLLEEQTSETLRKLEKDAGGDGSSVH